MTKYCSRCKQEKPIEDFGKQSSAVDGLRCWCKPCCNEYNKKYFPKGDRNRSLKNKHNITEDQYNVMLECQGFKCYICGSEDPKSKWAVFNVDHDHSCCPSAHSCGLCIRKLLCFTCNAALGNVADNIEVLKKMIDYLQEHLLDPDLASKKEILLKQKRRDQKIKKAETREKQSRAHTGKIISEETRKRMGASRRGKPFSKTRKENMSKARLAYFERLRKESN